MKTIKDILTDSIINGNNSFDIDRDVKITEDVTMAMGEYGAMLILAQQERLDREQYLNMQYYMEYCQMKGYVTPQEWIKKHKHF
jgi:hypothetical protein